MEIDTSVQDLADSIYIDFVEAENGEDHLAYETWESCRGMLEEALIDALLYQTIRYVIEILISREEVIHETSGKSFQE